MSINNLFNQVLNQPNTPSVGIQTEKKELNLDNPIFVFYIKTEGMTAQREHDTMKIAHKMFDIYNNVTIWIVSSNENRVECIYDGKSKIRSEEITHIIKEINNRVDILSNSKSFEDFKINIRDWRINELMK